MVLIMLKYELKYNMYSIMEVGARAFRPIRLKKKCFYCIDFPT